MSAQFGTCPKSGLQANRGTAHFVLAFLGVGCYNYHPLFPKPPSRTRNKKKNRRSSPSLSRKNEGANGHDIRTYAGSSRNATPGSLSHSPIQIAHPRVPLNFFVNHFTAIKSIKESRPIPNFASAYSVFELWCHRPETLHSQAQHLNRKQSLRGLGAARPIVIFLLSGVNDKASFVPAYTLNRASVAHRPSPSKRAEHV
ncbi:hypothetical protein VTI28DRAFT_2267 [Corynascus sepedonium]